MTIERGAQDEAEGSSPSAATILEPAAGPGPSSRPVLWRRNLLAMVGLMIATFGLYYPLWYLRREPAINALDSPQTLKRWPFYLLLVWVCASIVGAFLQGLGYHDGTAFERLDLPIRLLAGIAIIVQCFVIKTIIEDHLTGAGDDATPFLRGESPRLSGLLTFFFTLFYLQHVINTQVADRGVAAPGWRQGVGVLRVCAVCLGAALLLQCVLLELRLGTPVPLSAYLLAVVLTGTGLLRWRSPFAQPVPAAVFAAVLAAAGTLYAVPWTGRKVFLNHFAQVRNGMTLDDVSMVMAPYMEGAGPEYADGADPDHGIGVLVFKHAREGHYGQDLGVVLLRDGRVFDARLHPK